MTAVVNIICAIACIIIGFAVGVGFEDVNLKRWYDRELDKIYADKSEIKDDANDV